MPTPAQTYNSACTWLSVSRDRDGDTGEMVKTHSENGTLWVSVDIQTGRQSNEYGIDLTGGEGEIRIRNYPAVEVDDILVDGNGYSYQIDSIRLGDNELICDVHYNDTLEDFTEDDS